MVSFSKAPTGDPYIQKVISNCNFTSNKPNYLYVLDQTKLKYINLREFIKFTNHPLLSNQLLKLININFIYFFFLILFRIKKYLLGTKVRYQLMNCIMVVYI